MRAGRVWRARQPGWARWPWRAGWGTGRLRLARPSARAALLGLLLLAASAHVGSPDVWFAGDAGPYRVLVHIRAPGVIPGVAEVNVEVEGEAPDQVLVHVNRFDAATAPPPPDVARPVRGQPGTYRASLWVMTGGSNSVTVRVRGARGEGAVVVPATLVAFRRIDFSPPMAFALGMAGLLLFAGLVTIVGAAVRESALPPGVAAGAAGRRRGRLAMALTAAVLALALLGGKRWWDAEDRAHRASMFRPLTAAAEIVPGEDGTGSTLRFEITDPSWRGGGGGGDGAGAAGSARAFSPLIPDHGKLMHLFAVHEEGYALAHLHPGTADTVTFTTPLPPLPAGEYRIFADVTHESGFSQTLSASVRIPEDGTVGDGTVGDGTVGDGTVSGGTIGGATVSGGTMSGATVSGGTMSGATVSGGTVSDGTVSDETGAATGPAPTADAARDGRPGFDEDDAWFEGEPDPDGVATLADGSLMRWERGGGELVAGEPAPLRFSVTAPDGSPARLEPYMGMAAHAVVLREDGGVFIHLHPMGTVSGAAQMSFELRAPTDTAAGTLQRRLAAADAERARHAAHFPEQSTFTFPYAFPSAGRYRIWIQVQRDGRVLTGAFAARIGEPEP